MRKQLGIADGWLLLIGGLMFVGLLFGGIKMVRDHLAEVDRLAYQRGKQEVQAKFDKFVADTRLEAEKSESARRDREAADKLNEERRNAEFDKMRRERDGLYAAYRSLRDSRAGAGADLAGGLPRPAPGRDRICFARSAFDRAVETLGREIDGFIAGVLGVVEQGDRGIDVAAICRAWVSAFPKPQETKP
jgi:hypothetical protein